MIDFRYHIVSLISVFLALAVGIVLGAGPLRDYIADSLSGQVEQLREETEQLRTELDTARGSLDGAQGFIDSAAPALTSGVLPGYPVSLVVMPGVEAETVNALGDTLTEAGASVLNIVTVGEDLTNPAKRPFRSGIASSLTTYLDPEASEDASAEAIIGTALDQALTRYDPAHPREAAEDATSIIELLRSAELVSVDADILPTLLTVVIAAQEGQEEVRAAELGLVKGMAPERTVVSGTDVDGSLVHLLRADTDSGDTYTTTDSIGTVQGRILVPWALAALVAGESGSFGFAPGVSFVLPPAVEITEPEPIEPVEEDDEGEGAPDADASAGAALISGGVLA